MATFFGAILAGLAWMALTGASWTAFCIGAGLGLLVAALPFSRPGRPFGPVRAVRALGIGLRLLGRFLWDLLLANLEQTRIILSPSMQLRPGWVRFKTELETPAMRALLGVLVSLTPGSLTYEEGPAEDGGWILSLHVLDLRDEEAVIAHIRRSFEAPMRALEVL